MIKLTKEQILKRRNLQIQFSLQHLFKIKLIGGAPL